jgi:hypothetical protein
LVSSARNLSSEFFVVSNPDDRQEHCTLLVLEAPAYLPALGCAGGHRRGSVVMTQSGADAVSTPRPYREPVECLAMEEHPGVVLGQQGAEAVHG